MPLPSDFNQKVLLNAYCLGAKADGVHSHSTTEYQELPNFLVV